jgi:hypothetical protein
MTVWIDADAAPAEVKDVVFRAGKRLAIAVVVVANRRVEIPAAYPGVRTLVVAGRPDEADRAIVERATVISRSPPTSARRAARGAQRRRHRPARRGVHRGRRRRPARDAQRLEGARRGRARAARGPTKVKRGFAQTFDRVVTRLLRAAARRDASGPR